MFYTYILYSLKLNRYYIGFTAGTVEARLAKHLLNAKGFTAKTKDWKIVYSELYDDKKSAMMREKQLKGWKNKQRIQQLISSSSME